MLTDTKYVQYIFSTLHMFKAQLSKIFPWFNPICGREYYGLAYIYNTAVLMKYSAAIGLEPCHYIGHFCLPSLNKNHNLPSQQACTGPCLAHFWLM